MLVLVPRTKDKSLQCMFHLPECHDSSRRDQFFEKRKTWSLCYSKFMECVFTSADWFLFTFWSQPEAGIHKFHYGAQDHQNVENSCRCRAWATSLLTLLFQGQRYKSEDGVERSKAQRNCNMIANVKVVVYATWWYPMKLNVIDGNMCVTYTMVHFPSPMPIDVCHHP